MTDDTFEAQLLTAFPRLSCEFGEEGETVVRQGNKELLRIVWYREGWTIYAGPAHAHEESKADAFARALRLLAGRD